MNKRDVASLALKIAGIYSFIQTVPQLQFVLVYVSAAADAGKSRPAAISSLIFSSLLMIVLTAAAGLALIAFSDRWAAWLVGKSAEDTIRAPLSGSDLQAIAFAVVGVYLFVSALPRLVQTVLNFASFASSFSPALPISPAPIWPTLIGLIVQIAVSLWLFFGARRLSRFWHSWHPNTDTAQP